MRQQPPARKHLGHPGQVRKQLEERSWVRRFWLVFGMSTTIAFAAVFYFATNQRDQVDDADAYVSVQVKTLVGDRRVLVCKVSLVVDDDQQSGIQARQAQLRAVMSESLMYLYQDGDSRPKLSVVRDRLYDAINEKLPRKLQIRDLLIQDLVVGLS